MPKSPAQTMQKKAVYTNPSQERVARGSLKKQVTQGQNIVAERWAGAANPHPHPMPQPTSLPTQTQKTYKMLVFLLFDSFSPTNDGWADGRMDGCTDGQTKPLIELHIRN